MTPIFLMICILISVLLTIHLWGAHPGDTTGRKLLWSLILALPVAGWLFYGGLYKVPTVQPPQLRAKRTPGLGAAANR